MADNELRIKVSATDEASQTLDGVSGKVGEMDKQMKENIQTAGKWGAAIAGIGIVTLKGFIDAASESERMQAQLNAVLTSTGGIAGVTADGINEMAAAMQKNLAISDETVVAGASMLLTFTNVGQEVFPDATQAAIDMATALNQGVTPSAEQLSQQMIMVGKALNDPTVGATALRKVGVALTEQQMEQIKAFQASGDIMSAQKIILKELGTEYGGSAAAAAKTFQGRMNALGLAFGDIQENIGTGLLPILEKLIEPLTQISEYFAGLPQELLTAVGVIVMVATAFGGIIAAVGAATFLLPTLTAGFAGLTAILGAMVSPIGLIVLALAGLTLAYTTNFLGIQDIVNSVIDWMGAKLAVIWEEWGPKILAAWEGIKTGISTAMDFLWNSVIQPGMTLISDFVINNWDTISKVATAIFDAFTINLQILWDVLIGVFDVALNLLSGNWEGAWIAVQETGARIWETISSAFKNWFSILGDILTLGLNVVKNLFGGAWNWIKDTTATVFNGVKNTITGAIDYVVNWFTETAKPAVEGAFGNMFSGLTGIAKGVMNSVLGVIEGFVNGAIDAINAVIGAYNAVPLAPDLPLVSPVSLPRLARGGIVEGENGIDNVPAMLSPGELVLNRAQQTNVAAQLQNGENGRSVKIEINMGGANFYGDGEEFAKKIGNTIVDNLRLQYNIESFA